MQLSPYDGSRRYAYREMHAAGLLSADDLARLGAVFAGPSPFILDTFQRGATPSARPVRDEGKGTKETLTTAERSELINLRKRLKRAEMERDISRSDGLLCKGERMKFAFIHAEKVEVQCAAYTPAATTAKR